MFLCCLIHRNLWIKLQHRFILKKSMLLSILLLILVSLDYIFYFYWEDWQIRPKTSTSEPFWQTIRCSEWWQKVYQSWCSRYRFCISVCWSDFAIWSRPLHWYYPWTNFLGKLHSKFKMDNLSPWNDHVSKTFAH